MALHETVICSCGRPMFDCPCDLPNKVIEIRQQACWKCIEAAIKNKPEQQEQLENNMSYRSTQ